MRAVLRVALAGLLALGSLACEDLLQEPDTGIAIDLALEIVSGDDQFAAAGATLAEPLEVRLLDLERNPIARLRVEWSVIRGGGSVSPRNAFTDGEGRAATTWTLGPTVGEQVVEARVGNDAVIFTAAGR